MASNRLRRVSWGSGIGKYEEDPSLPFGEEVNGEGGLIGCAGVIVVCMAIVLIGLLATGDYAAAEPMLLEKIREARHRVNGLELTHQLTTVQEVVPATRRPKRPGRQPAVRYAGYQTLRRDVALVGLNLNTGELRDFIFEETVRLDHKNRLQVKPPQVIANDDTCELIWRGGSRWGFNRDLLLICNGEEFVIVNLTMWTSRRPRTVLTDQKTGKRRCRQGSAEWQISSYVPYSPELHTPEVIEEGYRYLEGAILQALQELDDLNVTSRAFPGRNLSEIASVEFIHALLVNEHMDPGEFKKNESDGMLSRLIEKYWVEIAINRDSAFRMSVSPAGAVGISQFICPTYARILDEFPEVKLDPVFVRGMQDHVNAVKASITLFDSDMSPWWTPTTRKICAASAEALEDCWAASYNGGPNRLNRVIARRGKDWIKKESRVGNPRRNRASRLKEETYTYLAKLRSIREHLSALDSNRYPLTEELSEERGVELNVPD